MVRTLDMSVLAVAGQLDLFGLWDGGNLVYCREEIRSKMWFMLNFRRVCSSGSGNGKYLGITCPCSYLTAIKQLGDPLILF